MIKKIGFLNTQPDPFHTTNLKVLTKTSFPLWMANLVCKNNLQRTFAS